VERSYAFEQSQELIIILDDWDVILVEDKYGAVYVDMMVDSLKRKQQILTFLYERTKEQERLLIDEDMDPDEFKLLVDAKGERLEELNTIDEGFDRLFNAVKKEIQANRDKYREQIQKMQSLIKVISDLGVQIQALEQQNSGHFQTYLARHRKVIHDFYVNNKTANAYYQNMAHAHKPQTSYFFDETK
jgi:hypothetical protein